MLVFLLRFSSRKKNGVKSMHEELSVAVGSKNPVKVEAVRLAFAAMFPNARVEATGYSVSSFVPSQPMDDITAMLGATHRAMRAAQSNPQADFAVGLEGGLCDQGSSWFARAWVAVLKDGKFGYGSTQSFAVPEKIMARVRAGKELGEACDEIFCRQKMGQHEGYFGLMTNGRITRTDAYKDACIVALIQHLNPELFAAPEL